MLKRKVMLILLFSILASSIVLAVDQSKVDKAYSCLEGKIRGKCSSLTFDEKAFGLLALSYNLDIMKECNSSLNSIKSSSGDTECWPSSGCSLRETSIAFLAKRSLNENTTKIQNWLTSQLKTAEGIDWFLEIITPGEANCQIYYKDSTHDIKINADNTLSGSQGECLQLAHYNNWYKIAPSCINENFKIKCDRAFSSTILYQKTGSDVWHVSNDLKSGDETGATTTHNISFYCFGSSGCDYEGSLWATYALKQAGKEVDKYLPYLISFAPDYQSLFPASFLYAITSSQEYLTQINSLQNFGSNLWENIGSRGKYYDTALAFLGLRNSAPSNAKEKIFENLDSNGCLNTGSLRDSEFLLWTGWKKQPATPCEDVQGYCMSASNCSFAQGSALSASCSGDKVCCNVPLQNCSSLSGFCISNSSCNFVQGGRLPGSCIGENVCCTKPLQTCSQLSGFCHSPFSCFNISHGNQLLATCSGGNICCDQASIQTKTCSQVGKKCQPGERCTGTERATADETFCCIEGDCVSSTCSQLDGQKCDAGYFCDVPPVLSADIPECCQGNCINKSCSELGGEICSPNEECSDSYIPSSNSDRCCPSSGSCQQSTTYECERNSRFCISSSECSAANGNVISSFSCPGNYVCCTDPAPIDLACNEKVVEGNYGEICESGKQCKDPTIRAADTDYCCFGGCEDIPTPETTECEQNNFVCQSSCGTDEVEKNFDCNSGEKCCGTKTIEDKKPSKLWIYILVILILLVLLGIIFRNQLRIFLHKFQKGKGTSSSGFSGKRPPFSPPIMPQRPMQRVFMPPRQITPIRPMKPLGPAANPTTKEDKEMEETFKKLKEMSK